MPKIETESILTCPKCGLETRETMPTSTCQIGFHCANCGATLRPEAGDCCVFCSYGSVPCASIQELRNQAETQPES